MNSLEKIRNWISILHSRVERLRRTQKIGNINLALYRLNRLLDICGQLQQKITLEANYIDDNYPAIARDVFKWDHKRFVDFAIYVLNEKTKEALKSSKEYGYAPFSERLLTAISDPKIADIVMVSSHEIKVKYRMNEVCGRLADYIDAVNQARKSNRKPGSSNTRGVGLVNPNTAALEGEDLASLMWREKIYGVFEGKKITRRVYNKVERKYETIDITALYKGVYESTVAERIMRMKTPAPFWSLLELGNINRPKFGSGRAFPVQQPTRFVAKATLTVNTDLTEDFSDSVDRIYELNTANMDSLRALMGFLIQIMEQIETLLREMEEGLVQYRKKLSEEILKTAMKDLEKAAAKKGKRPEPLQKRALEKRAEVAALQLISGEVEGRVSLGSYYEMRIRPRTRRIELFVASTIVQAFRPLEKSTIEELSNLAAKIQKEFLEIRKAIVRG